LRGIGLVRGDDARAGAWSYRLRVGLRAGHSFLLDAILTLALAALAEGEAIAGQLTGPRTASIPLGLAMALPLAARRRAPLLVLVAVMGAFAAQDAAGVKLQDNDLASVLVVLVAVYSVAAYAPPRAALAGAALTYLVLALTALRGLTGLLWALILVGGSSAAAWTLRTRRQEANAAREHARRVEDEHEARLMSATAEERSRIARELHDVVTHAVSVMVVQAGAGQQTLPADAAETRAALEQIQSTGRQALRELRRLLGVLRTTELQPLAPQPGLDDLEPLVASAVAAGTPVELTVAGAPPPLPAGLDLTAFRIVQEALTNVLKHAPGRSAAVRITYRPDAVELEITNDASQQRVNGVGHGLIGMRERAALYGGTLEAGLATGGRFRVRARLPLEPVS